MEYLAFGAIDKGDFLHHYIPTGEDFTICFRIQNNVISEDELKNLLLILSIFGGLGSKSRNGYGRFEVEGLTTGSFADVIKTASKEKPQAKFTAFSNDTTLYELNDNRTNPCRGWNYLLAKLSKSYLGARVNYHNGTAPTTNGLEDERQWSRRPYIAAPLLANNHQQPLKFPGGQIDLDRHAKTHFFGVVKENGNFKGYILHLPYRFLADSVGEIKGVTNGNLPIIQREYDTIFPVFNTKLALNSMTNIPL